MAAMRLLKKAGTWQRHSVFIHVILVTLPCWAAEAGVGPLCLLILMFSGQSFSDPFVSGHCSGSAQRASGREEGDAVFSVVAGSVTFCEKHGSSLCRQRKTRGSRKTAADHSNGQASFKTHQIGHHIYVSSTSQLSVMIYMFSHSQKSSIINPSINPVSTLSGFIFTGLPPAPAFCRCCFCCTPCHFATCHLPAHMTAHTGGLPVCCDTAFAFSHHTGTPAHLHTCITCLYYYACHTHLHTYISYIRYAFFCLFCFSACLPFLHTGIFPHFFYICQDSFRIPEGGIGGRPEWPEVEWVSSGAGSW